jgi:hypothetical protein
MLNFNPAQKNTPISMHWVNITPNQAQKILDHTRTSKLPQRNRSNTVAQKYADEMIGGTWHSNTADVIRLCVHGGGYAALDGQHRLGAIVKAEKAQDSWVALDVPPEAFKYIDQGSPRTLSHVMTAAGWERPSIMASVARMLFDQSKGRNPINSAPTQIASGTQFDWLVEHHYDLLDMSRTYGKVISKAAKNFHIQEAVLNFMFYHWEREDHDNAVKVIVSMADDKATGIFDLAYRIMNANHVEMLGYKQSGMAVRAEKQRFIQAMSMRFAWESYNGRAGTPTCKSGFKKCQTAWQAAIIDQKAWDELL